MKEDENEEYEMLDDGTVGDEGNEKAGHSAYREFDSLFWK